MMGCVSRPGDMYVDGVYILPARLFLPLIFKSLWRDRTLCVRSSYMLYGLLSIFVHINGLNQ